MKNEQTCKPIKVKFSTYLKKSLILLNLYKMKGTKISVAHDLCYNDRIDHKILRDHLKQAKAKNYPAKIKGNKLFVNNDIYTVQQLKQMQLEPTEESVNNTPRISQTSPRNRIPTTPNSTNSDSALVCEETNKSFTALSQKKVRRDQINRQTVQRNSIRSKNPVKKLRSSQKTQ